MSMRPFSFLLNPFISELLASKGFLLTVYPQKYSWGWALGASGLGGTILYADFSFILASVEAEQISRDIVG